MPHTYPLRNLFKKKYSFPQFTWKKTRRKCADILTQTIDFYENCAAIFIAQYLWFFYYPLYFFYKKRSICFLVNVAEGVGHIVPEIDYFFRCLETQSIDISKKYIFLRRRRSLSLAFIQLYRHKFYHAECSTWKHCFLLPMLIHFKDITIDVGYCRIKWQTPHPSIPYNYNFRLPFAYQTTKSEGAKRFASMFKLRHETNTFFPLHDFDLGKTALLLKSLGLSNTPFCLIHLKTQVCNATAAKTDPNTYLKALHFLLEKGYRLVFAGREQMPSEFKGLGMINYAQSTHATFENDVRLARASSLLITGGSGINTLGDYYDKPVLYLNSWHLALQFFHKLSVCVPTVVKEKNGRLLQFREQVDLAFSNDNEVHEIFPHNEYEAINASSEDIYQGLLELFCLIKNPQSRDPLYHRFVTACNKYDLLTYCESRVSAHFLQKYKHLF